MKKIFTKVLGAWFMGLRWWQKAIAIDFVISFIAIGCMDDGPWWVVLALMANFGVSAFCLRYVPVKMDNEA